MVAVEFYLATNNFLFNILFCSSNQCLFYNIRANRLIITFHVQVPLVVLRSILLSRVLSYAATFLIAQFVRLNLRRDPQDDYLRF